MIIPYKDMVENFFSKTRFKTESKEQRTKLLNLLEKENVAIIAGYATTGEQWTDQENIAADAALLQDLKKDIQCPIRVIGYDPESNHSEPSWAANIPLDQAITLATTYKQIAIFYITQDTLTIHSCLSEQPTYEVGAFLDQLDR